MLRVFQDLFQTFSMVRAESDQLKVAMKIKLKVYHHKLTTGNKNMPVYLDLLEHGHLLERFISVCCSPTPPSCTVSRGSWRVEDHQIAFNYHCTRKHTPSAAGRLRQFLASSDSGRIFPVSFSSRFLFTQLLCHISAL